MAGDSTGGAAECVAPQQQPVEQQTPTRLKLDSGTGAAVLPALGRPQRVALIMQLMSRNGVAGMAMVQRHATAGEGFTVRGIQMDNSLLQEALQKLSPSDKEQLANHLGQLQAGSSALGERPIAEIVNQAAGSWNLRSSSVWVRDYASPSSELIAAFDMDGTLIDPASDKEFGCTVDDWRWWNDCVPTTLRKFASQGFKLVLFTNQSKISSGQIEARTVHTLIDAVQSWLGVPLLALIATKDDVFRKPRLGMWDLMESAFNGGVKPKRTMSFFVGDAAGRAKVSELKKDFSDSDLKFALNIGVSFKTPEDFFLGADDRPVPSAFSFDPRSLIDVPTDPPGLRPASSDGVREVVLIIGPPCSGKSTLVSRLFSDYVRISSTSFENREQCAEAYQEALQTNRESLVIDDQNGDPETRNSYVNIAASFGTTVRAIHFDVPKELCLHLNTYRTLRGHQDSTPALAFDTYWSRFQPPLLSEGFSEIHKLTGLHSSPETPLDDVVFISHFLR